MKILLMISLYQLLIIQISSKVIFDIVKCTEVFSPELLLRFNKFFTNSDGEVDESEEANERVAVEINPPSINGSGDECHWKLDLSAISNFQELLITYGEAFTDGFSLDIRDDSKKIINGEGYSFYIYTKPHEQEDISAEDQDNANKTTLLQLQDSLSIFLADQGATSKAPIEKFSDGFLFRISFEMTQDEIIDSVLDTRYLGKCDLIFESVFKLMENIFGFEILNKQDIHVEDHREDLINYCAANFDILKTDNNESLRIYNKKVPDMKHLIFRHQINEDNQLHESQSLDRSVSSLNFPIKNLKIYFEKIRKVNEKGEVYNDNLEEDFYYTMNFHLFLYNEYSEPVQVQKDKLKDFSMKLERIYCLNFKCEDSKDGMQLNFMKQNRDVNPEHFYYVNYFKPAHIIDHIKRLNEINKEPVDENHVDDERRLLIV